MDVYLALGVSPEDGDYGADVLPPAPEDPEEAVSGGAKEFEMTEAERRKQEIREEEEKEQKAFEDAQQR